VNIDFSIVPAAGRHIQQPSAHDLAVTVPFVSFEDTNAKVLEVFGKYKELISLPVLDHGHPIGLISRTIFMSQMSKPYHRELYEKKSCIAFMDKDPLIVEAVTPIETLGVLAVQSGDKTLADGFMIVADGKLVGLGSGLELMRMLVELQSEKNRQVMQSIDYASVIQRAMLGTSREAMERTLNDTCLIWQPRDIVGGDFYYFEQFPDGWFAALADCTGHGVPGAFLTLIASSALKQALQQHGPRDPALLMSTVNKDMKNMLGQHTGTEAACESNDGMDGVFFWMNTQTHQLTCANARMCLLVLGSDQEQVEMVAAERTGLGYVETRDDATWTNTHIALAQDTTVLAVTDGIIDQIGGPKNIAFGKQRLRDITLEQRHLPMDAFGKTLMQRQQEYQGPHRRRDDLTVFGFRLTMPTYTQR
jgi:sigma-B regulation protein RsbU (phosphoserine phosphatase)